jgi:predicted Kef-type K+ transport protein
VHGIPALLYRPLLGNARAYAAGLFQATSLTFILAAVQIGAAIGLVAPAASAALTAAALLSILIFPFLGLFLLRRASVQESEQATMAKTVDSSVKSESEL